MDRFEWLSLWLFLAVFWIVDFLFYTYFGNPSKYHKFRTYIIPKPPAWVFFVVWNILYPLTAVSIWLYLNWATDNRTIYDAVLALSLANYALNKAWYPLFFGLAWLWMAFVDAALLLATAISVLVLLWIDTQNNGSSVYVAAGLYIPYVLWLIYAVLLNFDLAWNNSSVLIMYQEKHVQRAKRSFWNQMKPKSNVPPARGVVTSVNAPQAISTPQGGQPIRNKKNKVETKGFDANVFYRQG